MSEHGELLAEGKLDEGLLPRLRKHARSVWSRAIAKERRALAAAASLRDSVVRHNVVEARGPWGALAGRNPQQRGGD